MTISTTTSTITYGGNGVTTAWTFPFVADLASDLVVTVTTNTGVSSVISPTLYSVVLNAIPSGGLWAVGGTVNYPLVGSPLASGYTITITRSVPYTQTVSITNQGAFYPQVVEQGLDILELQLQQLITSGNFSLKFPTSDNTPPNTLPGASSRAGGYLAFDSSGQPIVTTAPTYTNLGSSSQARKVSTTGTATINVLTTDSFGGVSVYQSSTPVTTVQLPTTGGPYPVFDGGGNAATYNITILPPAGKTINGASSYVLNTNFQAATFYWDGTQYVLGSGSQGLGTNISVSGSISAGTTITAGTGITSTTGDITASAGKVVANQDVQSTAGHVLDLAGDVRNIPPSAPPGAYVATLADNGHYIAMNGSVTIPSGVFSDGNAFLVVNTSGISQTLVQGSGMTVVWGGVGSSGNRTIAATGVVSVLILGSTSCVITGAGIS